MCRTTNALPPLEWAAPIDQSGTYGATHVECRSVHFGPGGGVGPYSLVRQLEKIWEVLLEL